MCIKNLLIYFLASFVMLSSHALEIVGLSPQGEVSQVRQVVVNFDEPASAFGTSKGAAPVNIRCGKDPLVCPSVRRHRV
jgi:hypothetical protein